MLTRYVVPRLLASQARHDYVAPANDDLFEICGVMSLLTEFLMRSAGNLSGCHQISFVGAHSCLKVPSCKATIRATAGPGPANGCLGGLPSWHWVISCSWFPSLVPRRAALESSPSSGSRP